MEYGFIFLLPLMQLKLNEDVLACQDVGWQALP